MRTAAKYFARLIILIIVGANVALFLSSCSVHAIPEKDVCMCDTLYTVKVDTALVSPHDIPVKRSIKMTPKEKRATLIAVIATILIMNVN